jgi:hypothetical protein
MDFRMHGATIKENKLAFVGRLYIFGSTMNLQF